MPVVTVLYSGRPVPVNDLINRSDAFVAAWLPGTEGRGLTDLLLAGANGRAAYDFTGKLSFDWPAGDCLPQEGGYQFRRGYGLSYAISGSVGRLPEVPALRLTSRQPLDAERRRGLGLALQVAGELGHAVEILRRDMDVAIIELGRGAQRPHRVDQMRPGERDQVGAAGGEDRIGVVGLVDVADRHGREPRLVADLVGERRLEHAAIDRLRLGPGLAGRDVDQVGALAREGFGDRAPPRRA